MTTQARYLDPTYRVLNFFDRSQEGANLPGGVSGSPGSVSGKGFEQFFPIKTAASAAARLVGSGAATGSKLSPEEAQQIALAIVEMAGAAASFGPGSSDGMAGGIVNYGTIIRNSGDPLIDDLDGRDR